MKRLFFYLLLLFLGSYLQLNAQQSQGTVWTAEKANAWYTQHKWLTGCNYYPSNAINQLEMWQADTFSPERIDEELGWAENLGFNTMRVYLHSLAWKQNAAGFKKRINKYLSIADKHGIKTIFVFFDDCWNKTGKIGKQPEPKIGIHNSGWLQDPGDPAYKDESLYPELEKYVKDILTTFATDKRVLMWDLYNEPGNNDKKDSSLPLLKKIFSWARDINPSQPLTSGVWDWSFEELNKFQIANSDVITYHDYRDPVNHKQVIQVLKSYGKPLICTEYMARTNNSRFYNIMPLLKEENVGAINWGFVCGKSNTIFAWHTPLTNGHQPDEWFHDILLPDGSPYCVGEVNVIKRLNNEK